MKTKILLMTTMMFAMSAMAFGQIIQNGGFENAPGLTAPYNRYTALIVLQQQSPIGWSVEPVAVASI